MLAGANISKVYRWIVGGRVLHLTRLTSFIFFIFSKGAKKAKGVFYYYRRCSVHISKGGMAGVEISI